jgi:ferritin
MLNKKVQDALNEQLNAELYSSYLYVAMSAYFEATNLRGFAHWMRVQAKEEQDHAMKFYGHVVDRRGRVTLKPIEGPRAEWASPVAAFEDTLAHERKVTGLINALLKLANEHKDTATAAFLQWFVTEQVDEEANADEVVQKLKLIGDSTSALFMLDSVLGQRKE